MATAPAGPVLFAYDGSELAKLAIEEAGRQLAPGREALIACVWQPVDVGFVPAGERHLDATQATEVCAAAEEVAAIGAKLAEQAGFEAEGIAVKAAPTWQGLLELAEERGASLIVLGSHLRTGIAGRMLGSVASAVVTNSAASVMVVRSAAPSS
jgi:nucleotide-binding universal stress UspA family protein